MDEDQLTYRKTLHCHKSSVDKCRTWENDPLFFGEEKVKFVLHPRIPLLDEEMRACMKIESSFSLIKDDAPKILQEDTLEGYKFEANSFPTK